MTHCHWQRFECISVLLWISSDAIRSHWPGGAMCHWLSFHSMQPSQKQESFNAIAHLLVHCFAFVTLWYLVSISQFATCWCCRYNAMSNIDLMQKMGRNHLWRILSGTKVQNWQPFCSVKEDGGVRRPWRLWPLASGGNGPELSVLSVNGCQGGDAKQTSRHPCSCYGGNIQRYQLRNEFFLQSCLWAAARMPPPLLALIFPLLTYLSPTSSLRVLDAGDRKTRW